MTNKLRDKLILGWTRSGDKGRVYRVSPNYFFATSNKERNPPYLQLRRRLNGKMLVFEFFLSQKRIHSPAWMRKTIMLIDCVFREILTNTCTLNIVHSKPPFHGHDPKFLFPHRYKTVPSVYNKKISRWSSTAQIWSKCELYTYKPSQLHRTVPKKCYCKISYGTTFDYYDPDTILQWCDTITPPIECCCGYRHFQQ